MTRFATYLHPHVFEATKPLAQIPFVGYSVPHFKQVGEELARLLTGYPNLPIQKVDLTEYGRVHPSNYLKKLEHLSADLPVENPPKLSIECAGYPYLLPGHQYGLGGLYAAIDQMKTGKLERAYVVCLGGHHAYADWGHGYCMLNPMAVAVRYAQAQGFQRVVILDWDLHHGDGTQAIFAHDPTVYHISIHSAADLYMAVAAGMRHGNSTMAELLGHCNIPLLHATYPDEFWQRIDENGRFYRAANSLTILQEKLETLPFQPDFLFIFSGYDAHVDDRGKDITNWTNQDYEYLTRLALRVAQRAGCPVLSQHGGGYTLPVTVSAALSHVHVLADTGH